MIPASRVDPVDVPSKFGRTVREAELLLRKAKRCIVFVRTNMNGNATLFDISKTALRAELKQHRADEHMPAELNLNSVGGPKLIIGGIEAIEQAHRSAGQ